MRQSLIHTLGVALALVVASWALELPVTAGGQSPNAATPEAIAALAKSVGFTDIVGVKLGMTLEQAVAALKASNPKLVIEVHDSEITAGGKVTRRPRVILAHLPAASRNPEIWANLDGSQDSVGVQLTPPPGPMVVEVVVRYVSFASNAPVAASSLLDALRKKYGPEGFDDHSQWVDWLFDTTGKPVTGPLVQLCGNRSGPSMLRLPGGDIRGGSSALAPGRVFEPVNSVVSDPSSYTPDDIGRRCAANVVVRADIYHPDPSKPVGDFWVTLQSPALMQNSMALAAAFIKGATESQIKKQDDDAAKRAVPKL